MKLFLHIGTIKTGSTTLQRFLLHNRGALAQRGLAVPELFGRAVEPVLLAAAVGNPQVVEHHRKIRVHVAPETRIPSPAQAAQELERAFGDLAQDTAVFSWEGLPIFLSEAENVLRLRDLLARVCDEITVIAYLRRQDALYASLYGEMLFQGHRFGSLDKEFSYADADGAFTFGESGSNLRWFDYHGLLQPWADAFGRGNILVRPFERRQLLDGDVVADFLNLLGLDKNGLETIENTNVSLDRFQMEFLRRTLRHVPGLIEGHPNAALRRLGRILHDEMPRSTKLTVPSSGARAFLTRFADSNARVAREYLGREDGVLFLDQAPEDGESLPELTADKAAEITGQLWNRQWEATERRRSSQDASLRAAAAHAATLRDANTALYALSLHAAGERQAAKDLLEGIPDLEQRDDIRSHLFQTYALRSATALSAHLKSCPDVLSPRLLLHSLRESLLAAPLHRMPRPKRVLVFRSAPELACEDLYRQIFLAWPEVEAYLAVQEGSTSGETHPFNTWLVTAAGPFSAAKFFARHNPGDLLGRYDLVIVPVNGNRDSYREFFAVAQRIGSLCTLYSSLNLLLPQWEKRLEAVAPDPACAALFHRFFPVLAEGKPQARVLRLPGQNTAAAQERATPAKTARSTRGARAPH